MISSTIAVPCLAASRQRLGEGLLHARNIRDKLFGPRMVDILSETRPDLDIARAEYFGDRKKPGPQLVGFLAPLAVEMPIHKEFQLHIFDPVGSEDALHLGMTDLGGGGIDVVGDESHALPSSAGCRLDPVAKGERTDLGRSKRIRVAGEREISSDQFNILSRHGLAPVEGKTGTIPSPPLLSKGSKSIAKSFKLRCDGLNGQKRKRRIKMDVRNAKIEPTIEHGGTCRTFFMFPKETIRDATEGSYLEYVSEFEIAPGTHLEPHKHNTHEFFYILSGRALMQVGREKREVEPGDLIHIPPNTVHSIAPLGTNVPMRALAFAASFMPPGGSGTEAETAKLPE